MEKISFDNENTNKVKNYFLGLFNKLYQQNNYDYDLTLTKLTEELENPTTDFHEKNFLITYIVAKAVEINHYRKKLGVMKEEQDHSLDILRKLEQGGGYVMRGDYKNAISDALYYMISTNRAYQQEAIKSTFAQGLNKELYKSCPILLAEHMETLFEEPSGKEAVLANLEKAITLVFEKTMFSMNEHPTPKAKNDIFKKTLPSLFIKNVCVIIEEDENEKILMCEILYTVLREKEKDSSLSFMEYNLFHLLKSCSKTKKALLNFYDSHRLEIISFFTKSTHLFDRWKKEGLLEDQSDFMEARGKK